LTASDLELTFSFYYRNIGRDLPRLEKEYTFARPRRWRFDFALPSHKIAIEIEGGVWSDGRHMRGTGFNNDCDKYNTATVLGWRVLRFTEKHLRVDPQGCVDMIRALIEEAKP
jgi:very-short-patch-repair endonuclease